jgi:orotidine-5'-phosphate decarboxylase
MDKDVIIACDFFSQKALFKFLRQFKNEKPFLKIGYQLYFSEGNKLIKKLKKNGYKIFLDLKLHDIPNTVANGIKSLSKLNVDFISLHVSSGSKALDQAYSNKGDSKLIGITVLTSLDQKTISHDFKIRQKPEELVESLTKMANDSLIDGLVCSVKEAKIIKKINPNILVICPGIRLLASTNDQKRVATPEEAKQNNVDYIVVGREITESSDPHKTYWSIKNAFV